MLDAQFISNGQMLSASQNLRTHPLSNIHLKWQAMMISAEHFWKLLAARALEHQIPSPWFFTYLIFDISCVYAV